MQYLAMPEVKRNTALHKQRDMIQLTGSTYCTSIPLIIIIDKEDKTHFHTFRLLLFSSFKGNMFYNKIVRLKHRGLTNIYL